MGEERFIIRLNRVDLVTLSGLPLTAAAILSAVHGHPAAALGFLFLAVLFDAFDGVLARHYGLERDFGRYLDGFVDTFDYLVAPAVWFYTMGFDSLWAVVVLLLFIAAGIVRLAVFNGSGNLREGEKLYYRGMPVFWSAFVAAGYYFAAAVLDPVLAEPLLGGVLLLYALLMVRNRRCYKPRNKLLMLAVTVGLSLLFFTLELLP